MIVRFARSGTSFKGVSAYLSHDPDRAITQNRVAWTHTLNLAHDHLPSAVHEMVSTCRDADVLKAQAGIASGSAVGKPVKHFSLNWHPGEQPEREAMVAAVEAFLMHMGWQEHQALLVAHNDRLHAHVHVVVNAVHPETGRKLDDGFEHRRAQSWALGYEQAAGRILCPERLKNPAAREPAMPRPVWQRFKESIANDVAADAMHMPELSAGAPIRAVSAHPQDQEWADLKRAQREERIDFFAQGRDLYKAVAQAAYRETRAALRSQWASYYAASRSDPHSARLPAMRAELIEHQARLIEEHRSVASNELRQWRDEAYRALLDAQKEERHEFARARERGEAFRRPESRTAIMPSLPLLVESGGSPDAWRQDAIQRPLVWTGQAGMVAQNRAAMRWLDRAGRRTASPVSPVQSYYPPREIIDRVYDRRGAIAAGVRPRSMDKSVGVEPD